MLSVMQMINQLFVYLLIESHPNIFDQQVVYVARNPKDVVVSFYHHSRIFKNHNYTGSFEEFLKYFIDGDCK